MTEFLPALLDGARVTVEIFAASAALALAIGFVAGLARLSPFAVVRWTSVTYVEFFRGSSLLVQLFWLFFVLPHFGVTLTPYQTAVLGLGLNIGAYGSEVVRGAILAVPQSQRDCAAALGLRPGQAMLHVVLPLAARRMLPPWGNLMIELLKGTALVSLITVADLTFRAYQLNQATFRTTEIFSSVLIIYFLLALAIMACTRMLERFLGRGMYREAVR